MRLSILILLAAFSLSGLLNAQWGAIDRAPSKPVLSGSNIVAHQNDDGVQAFSPTAGTWKLIAEPSAVLMEVGEWVALVQTSEGWLGYSARLHDTALLVPPTPGAQLATFQVAGELMVMIFRVPSNAGSAVNSAYAYSAQSNAWRSVALVSPLSVLPDQMLNTGLAIGINDGDRYHGFAARTGEWATHSLTGIPPQGANLTGEGNVLAALVLGLFPNTSQVLAFSGVRGTWSVSPVELDAFNLEVDNNVAVALAFSVAPGGAAFQPLAYSAYTAEWVACTTGCPVAEDVLVHHTDNVVALVNFSPGSVHAFGARPGKEWAHLPTNGVHSYGDDYLIAGEASPHPLWVWGFSGLAGGTWNQEQLSWPGHSPSMTFTFMEGPAHIGVVEEYTHSPKFFYDAVHAFCPSLNSWATISVGQQIMTSQNQSVVGQSVLFSPIYAGEVLSTRFGAWTSVPATPSPNSLQGAERGHTLLVKNGLGIKVYNGRTGQISTPFSAHPWPLPSLDLGSETSDCNMVLARYSNSDGEELDVFAYSAQRDDWTSPGPHVYSDSAVLGENILWLEDKGKLWAFGSLCEGHVWYDWPNGKEYHIPDDGLSAHVPELRYSLRAEPGSVFALYGSSGLLSTPLSLLPNGAPLWLDFTGSLLLSPLGSFGSANADGLIQAGFPIPAGLQPVKHFFFQPLILNGSNQFYLGNRFDPAWIF